MLVLGACQGSWYPAHITPLFHVQAVRDPPAKSQAESIIFTVARKAECWPEWREVMPGSLWGGQVSAL